MDVLREIRDAETAADDIRKQAAADSKDIIKSVSEQAQKVIDDASLKARDIRLEIIREMENEANQKAGEILKQGDAACDSIKLIAEDKLDRAVSLVIERIVSPNGNS